MSVNEIKQLFKESAHKIGKRDSKVLPTSALRGYVFVLTKD